MEPVSIGGCLLPLRRGLALGASVLFLLAAPVSAGIEDTDPEAILENLLDTDPGEVADNMTKKLPPPYGEPVHVSLPVGDAWEYIGDYQVTYTCTNPDFCIFVGTGREPCAGVQLRGMAVEVDATGLWVQGGTADVLTGALGGGAYGGYNYRCQDYDTVGLPLEGTILEDVVVLPE